MPKARLERRLTGPDQEGTLAKQSKPDRSSTRCVSAHLPEEMYWQLKEVAASKRVEMQTIIADAVNALFEKNGRPAIPITPHNVRSKHLTVGH